MVVDARWLRTGIGRYTLSLLQGLREELQDVPLTCITLPSQVPLVSGLCDRVIPCSAGIYGCREQLQVPWLARNQNALYVPHYNIPILWKRPLLVTIHDLNHLLDASYRTTWKTRLYARPLLRTAVKNATVIVTPSHYTKRKLVETFDVEPGRVSVIPLSVASCFQPARKSDADKSLARAFGLTRPFLLFVGNCAPNKNVPLLLKAFAQLQGRSKDAPLLVLAGGDRKWKPQIQRQISALKIQDNVVWLDTVSDAQLADLYSAAEMTLVPSLEEGFGLPVIESMACGTPVICAEAASLPEVAGNAALLVSPHSSEQWVDAIDHVLHATGTRQRLVAAGLTRSALFSQQKFIKLQAVAIRKLLSPLVTGGANVSTAARATF